MLTVIREEVEAFAAHIALRLVRKHLPDRDAATVVRDSNLVPAVRVEPIMVTGAQARLLALPTLPLKRDDAGRAKDARAQEHWPPGSRTVQAEAVPVELREAVIRAWVERGITDRAAYDAAVDAETAARDEVLGRLHDVFDASGWDWSDEAGDDGDDGDEGDGDE